MTGSGRLNGIISKLEAGKPVFAAFSPVTVDAAVSFSTSPYDAIILEAEHTPWDGRDLSVAMQYLLSRRLIAGSGSLAPSVTPIVRVPPNGAELNQWFAKQALDLGAYGIVWPHISTVEEAYNAVAACRYPRLSDKPRFEPQGIRGDGPAAAVRYWGTSLQDYYRRADTWPLEPGGDILVMLMIEDTKGISNLREILRAVPGIGAVMIGEGDLSQELGYPRQYEHPAVLSAMAEIVAICREEGVVCGHPHVSPANAQRVLDEGFRFLMVAPNRSHDDLEHVQALSGRS